MQIALVVSYAVMYWMIYRGLTHCLDWLLLRGKWWCFCLVIPLAVVLGCHALIGQGLFIGTFGIGLLIWQGVDWLAGKVIGRKLNFDF